MDKIVDLFPDFNEDVEGGDPSDSFITSTPAIVFLIDVRKGMLAVEDGMENQPVLLSLQCIRQWIRNFIFKSSKCFCSIVFVGSGETKNALNSKNIYSVLDLKLIDAAAIKLIDEVMDLLEKNKFEEEYEDGDFSLADALWIASNMLTELKRKTSKQIILFTNDGCPFPKPQDRVRVFAKIADLKNLKIQFQLIPFGNSFETKFYKELLNEMGDGWDDDKCGKVLKLEDVIYRGPVRKPHLVALAKLPFVISPDFSIPVKIHSIVGEVKNPYEVTLSKATNLPVSTKSTFIRDNNEEKEFSKLEPSNSSTIFSDNLPKLAGDAKILYYENIGTECVTFTASEMEEINAVGSRRLELLGFKPRSTLSLELHIHPCAFLYPNEEQGKGASCFFQALMESCRKKDVVAICSYCPRPTATVRYVALDVHFSPPGFLLIYLPFGDEIRDIEELCMQDPEGCASEEQVKLMEHVIKKLRRDFDPQNFPNPPLAAYWAGVDALALDLPEPEVIADSSAPDYDQMRNRLADLPEKYYESFYPEGYSSILPKVKKPSDPISDIRKVIHNYNEDTLHLVTADQLKMYLKSVGLGVGLSNKKKADLVRMVTKYLEKNPTM